jgi:2-oxoglutarate ferredoxin oxidoreductase subunit beta
MMTTVSTNNLVYERPHAFTESPTHYCPGCTHGVAHRLIAEVLQEMNLLDKTIGVAPVGCAVFVSNYFDVDFVEAPHGRAPAMATGIKRVPPDRVVFTYQGDGDLASIGMGEIVHAAARGENLTVIFINNANFGMTGGQMAPTTLPGMKTSSSMNGRVHCMTRKIFALRRKPSALRLRLKCAGWASRSLNCSPPAPPTGV